MRFMYVLLCVLLLSSQAYSQSGQYKRATKNSKEKVNKKSQNEKVDIKGLEEQYWTPQDTEFKVVQNRKYSKAGKLGFSLQMGPLMNDSYAEGTYSLGATLSYYFSEFMGMEVNYTKYDLDKSKIVKRFESTFGGASPDYSIQQDYFGIAFNWVPIYGKMSILDNKIIYYDLAISPTIGMESYEQQVDPASTGSHGDTKSAFTYGFDISQHFFFAEKWAIRVDMKNRYYEEDLVTSNNGSPAGTATKETTLWQLGFTYYFSVPSMLKSKKEEKKDKTKKK